MASDRSIAIRREEATARLAAAATALVTRFDLTLPDDLLGRTAKDPQIAAVLQLESYADVLEALDAATDPQAKAAATRQAKATLLTPTPKEPKHANKK